ncbi:MAG: BrnT family toxin [Betaproteobacteria bacterium]|nr:BrnT family toxin [Betaproteobacteria bacterium]
MLIEFDPAKDALNIAKHGVSLTEAKGFEWDSARVRMDTREDYGEERMIALGYIGARLFCMAFVERNDACRVISLRRATRSEAKSYAET